MIINVHGQFPMAMLNCQRVGVSMFSYVLPHQESQHWRVKPDPSPVFHGHCWNQLENTSRWDWRSITTSWCDVSTTDSLLPHGFFVHMGVWIVAPGQLELLDQPEPGSRDLLWERNSQSWAANVWQIQWLIQEIRHVDGHF